MFRIKNILLFAVVTLLTSCGTDFFGSAEDEYCDIACNFIFYAADAGRQSSLLVASVKGYDVFSLVSADNNKVYVERANGSEESFTRYGNLEPTPGSLIMGSDNGIFIGHAAFEDLVLAFDRCCPKCTGKVHLEWSEDKVSTVYCSKCKSEFNLTIVGNGLNRFPARYEGNYIKVINN